MSAALPDEAGTVTVEYAVVLALVALGFTIAVARLATPLLSLFRLQCAWLLLPIP